MKLGSASTYGQGMGSEAGIQHTLSFHIPTFARCIPRLLVSHSAARTVRTIPREAGRIGKHNVAQASCLCSYTGGSDTYRTPVRHYQPYLIAWIHTSSRFSSSSASPCSTAASATQVRVVTWRSWPCLSSRRRASSPRHWCSTSLLPALPVGATCVPVVSDGMCSGQSRWSPCPWPFWVAHCNFPHRPSSSWPGCSSWLPQC